MARRYLGLCCFGLVAGLGGFASSASAATTCVFTQVGDRMRLVADCQTDSTLFVPNGVTLDGRGHRITAVDPPGGSFSGAIVRNAGAQASVQNLVLDTRALTPLCHSDSAPDQRLRGILLESASGTVANNRVLNVTQNSGCQEGNAIEVRNAPFDGTHPGTQRVSIAGNYVAGYQKTGILVNGDVRAEITANRVVGSGPLDRIAQNGIQLGFGAFGRVQANRVEQNLYMPGGVAATCILLLEGGDGSELTANAVDDCDVGIYLQSTSGAALRANRVSNSTTDGITLDGIDGLTQDNRVSANAIEGNALGIDIAGEGANLNEIEHNLLRDNTLVGVQVAFGADANALLRNAVQRSGAYGIWVGTNENRITGNHARDTSGVGLHVQGEANQVQRNVVVDSETLDVENAGANGYSGNRCDSSSGAPVDCP
jgi:parallel beta-helix repeat protein